MRLLAVLSAFPLSFTYSTYCPKSVLMSARSMSISSKCCFSSQYSSEVFHTSNAALTQSEPDDISGSKFFISLILAYMVINLLRIYSGLNTNSSNAVYNVGT